MKVEFLIKESLPSTNSFAKENLDTFNRERLTCITAKEQTGGRGRFDRSFHSPQGGLYTTFVLFIDSLQPAQNSAQIAAFALANLLKELGLNPTIKWPNDVLLDGKKVAGILAETVQTPSKIALIVGIGVNVNTPIENAASVTSATNKTYDLTLLQNRLLEKFLAAFLQLKTQGFAPFVPTINALLSQKDMPLTLHSNNSSFEGLCVGIDNNGYLLLKLPTGEIRPFASGQTSSHPLL